MRASLFGGGGRGLRRHGKERHGRLRAVRKDIARIYTILRERELGIRTAPGDVK